MLDAQHGVSAYQLGVASPLFEFCLFFHSKSPLHNPIFALKDYSGLVFDFDKGKEYTENASHLPEGFTKIKWGKKIGCGGRI